MGKKLFILLLISSLLCLNLLPFCLSETNYTNKGEEDHYKQLKQRRPKKDFQGNEQINVGAAVVRITRGRGVYGAGNDMHHGHSKNDANFLRIKSTSSSLWKVSCGFFSFCLLLTGF